MKTKNKINVLELISPEMKQVMQFYADNPQPTPENDGYPSMRLAYNQDRRYWNADAPEMFSIQDISVSTSYGNVLTRLYKPKQKTPATGCVLVIPFDDTPFIDKLIAHLNKQAIRYNDFGHLLAYRATFFCAVISHNQTDLKHKCRKLSIVI